MLLNKASLRLATLAPDEESRYTLRAICVNASSAVVTNGHYLVIATHPTRNDDDGNPIDATAQFPVTPGLEHRAVTGNEELLVSRDAAIAALKALPKKTTLPILANAAIGADGNLYVNTLENVAVSKYTAEGKFPNWQAVMPTGEPVAEIAFDAHYLKALAQYFIDAQSDKPKSVSVRLTIYSKDTAARFDARNSDGQYLTAVLMPMRIDKCDFAKRPQEMPEPEKIAAD